jgi:hypothetical protein
MARLLFVLLVCGLALGWLHAEDKPAAKEPMSSLELYPPDVKPSMRVRIPVKKTEVVDQVVDGVVRKTEVTRTTVAEQPIPVPTAPEEIQKLRDELKAFRQQQIDALEVETLVRQVYEEREAAREKEAWEKLEEVRRTLEALENEFDGTKAGEVSRQLQGQIPDSLKAATRPPVSDPFGRTKPRSSGLIPLPGNSVRFGPSFEAETDLTPLKEI